MRTRSTQQLPDGAQYKTDFSILAQRRGAPLVKLCRDRGWHGLLRICKEHTLRGWMKKGWADWLASGHLIHKAGQQWFGRVLCWHENTIDTARKARYGTTTSVKPGS